MEPRAAAADLRARRPADPAGGGVAARLRFPDHRAQCSDVDDAYRIEFAHEGDSCDEYLDVHLSIDTGEAMACTSLPLSFGGSLDFPGFTSAQQTEIGALVQRLAADGLAEAEQQRNQSRVDEIAAAVPDSARSYHYTGLWGTGLAWLGGAIVVAALVLFFTLRRRLESWLAGG
ncbi:hypothetical protein QRX50_23560 [Amycolatopsis carbonis]|uniref:Uncharacterized protein n=1 Tax=Amycolatopsis carbonis TaxID=715471 RepID=A0A9Y2IQ96_9PSEU|nr:hypothetical protein [Amycolatopsis sp. 2-15]WIX83524.1 hypothetical protein QRX50_23560 [Amycolatopsis sp. 2-15]